jgi:hypothetical protein
MGQDWELASAEKVGAGPVLLTTSIRLIKGSIFLRIMTMDVSSGQFDGEGFAGQTGKLGRFAKGENLLPVESRRQFATKPRLHFAFRKTKSLGHRIRNLHYE